jgi:hypothetical protein
VTGLTDAQIVQFVELLTILLGIVITWAVYYGSDQAELPGEAPIPEPEGADDLVVDTEGRTIS